MKINTGNILEKDFKNYLDKKYIKYADAEEIREEVKVEFLI